MSATVPRTLLVAIGASGGALARLAISAVLSALSLGSAWPLLLINVSGSALMGWLKPGPFWGTGVLGGFTSFASFAYLTSEMEASAGLGYLAATVIGCIGAYLLGDALPKPRRANPPSSRSVHDYAP